MNEDVDKKKKQNIICAVALVIVAVIILVVVIMNNKPKYDSENVALIGVRMNGSIVEYLSIDGESVVRLDSFSTEDYPTFTTFDNKLYYFTNAHIVKMLDLSLESLESKEWLYIDIEDVNMIDASESVLYVSDNESIYAYEFDNPNEKKKIIDDTDGIFDYNKKTGKIYYSSFEDGHLYALDINTGHKSLILEDAMILFADDNQMYVSVYIGEEISSAEDEDVVIEDLEAPAYDYYVYDFNTLELQKVKAVLELAVSYEDVIFFYDKGKIQKLLANNLVEDVYTFEENQYVQSMGMIQDSLLVFISEENEEEVKTKALLIDIKSNKVEDVTSIYHNVDMIEKINK